MKPKTPGFLAIAMTLTISLPLVAASTHPATAQMPAKPPVKPQSVDELMVIIHAMQAQIVELQDRVESLEAALSQREADSPESGGNASATALGRMLEVRSIEQQEPDPEVLDAIAELKAQADVEDDAAAKAQKEADGYISKHDGRNYDPYGSKSGLASRRTHHVERQRPLQR
jgi:hypothetical protein